jgi:hypothetical protein
MTRLALTHPVRCEVVGHTSPSAFQNPSAPPLSREHAMPYPAQKIPCPAVRTHSLQAMSPTSCYRRRSRQRYPRFELVRRVRVRER